MKLLIDMSLSPLWVDYLAGEGFEAIHWSRVGDPSAEDCRILSYAANQGFVVFTHDLDFGSLLAAAKWRTPSVIQIRAQDVLPNAVGQVVTQALRKLRSEIEAGALVTVEPSRDRVRLLPILDE